MTTEEQKREEMLEIELKFLLKTFKQIKADLLNIEWRIFQIRELHFPEFIDE